MQDKEEILDSGEIYKHLDPLEFSIEKDEPVDWTKITPRAKFGGSWWRTHHLVALNKEILMFVPSVLVLLLGAFFLSVGVYLIFLVFRLEDWFAPFLLGGVLCLSGIKLMLMHTVAWFHKGSGNYTKRIETSQKLFNTGIGKLLLRKQASVKLIDISAIQLLKEKVVDSDGDFYSYEINLVMKKGKRINVVDHGNEKAATSQAKRLATFLKIPLLTSKHHNSD